MKQPEDKYTQELDLSPLAQLMGTIQPLVKGVEVDLDAALPDEEEESAP